jgi:hypothetical protein
MITFFFFFFYRTILVINMFRVSRTIPCTRMIRQEPSGIYGCAQLVLELAAMFCLFIMVKAKGHRYARMQRNRNNLRPLGIPYISPPRQAASQPAPAAPALAFTDYRVVKRIWSILLNVRVVWVKRSAHAYGRRSFSLRKEESKLIERIIRTYTIRAHAS